MNQTEKMRDAEKSTRSLNASSPAADIIGSSLLHRGERETSSIYDVRLEGGGQKHPNFADRHDINFVNRGLGGPKLLNR